MLNEKRYVHFDGIAFAQKNIENKFGKKSMMHCNILIMKLSK